MANPKGMRSVQFDVNATDAIHVYSDDKRIWIQLRRLVPTEADIGKTSFKSAFCLTAGTAEKLGMELLQTSIRNKEKQRAHCVGSAAKGKSPA
jgi:hypothetical protein